MLITVQFPLVDLRPFIPYAARLPKPSWPRPRTAAPPEFVRYFGEVQARPRGADPAYPDERVFAGARRALFLEAATGARAHELWRGIPRYRRLYTDGRAVARVELGLVDDRRHPRRLTHDDIARVVEFVLSAPAVVTTPDNQREPRALVTVGKQLASLYQSATSPSGGTPGHVIDAGPPVVLVSCRRREAAWFTGAQAIADRREVAGAELAFASLQVAGALVPVWMLAPGQATGETLRRLRVCLLRTYAEATAADSVVRGLIRGDIPRPQRGVAANIAASNNLQSFLRDATKRLKARRVEGFDRDVVAAAEEAVLAAYLPGDLAQLRELLKDVRRQIREGFLEAVSDTSGRQSPARVVVRRVAVKTNKGIIAKSISTGGSLTNISAKRLQGNLEIARAVPSEALRMALEDLNVKVEWLVQSTEDAKTATSLAEAAEQLTQEAAKVNPLKRTLKEFGHRIVSVGKTIGGGAVLVEAVNNVLKAAGFPHMGE